MQIARILVPTDFGPAADAALDAARVLAGSFGASVLLLHVLDDETDALALPEGPGVRGAMLDDARARLRRRLTPHDRQVLHAESEVVFGRGAATIVAYAESRNSDLIVMGTHGRTGMAHLLLGSAAEHVIRHAPCPVMTLRGTGQEAPTAVAGRTSRSDTAPDRD